MKEELLEEILQAIKLAEKGRGTAKDLVKASPVQIRIYNIFTYAMNELSGLKALVEDAQGVYMKGKK